MARKTEKVVITAENRDKGKTYLITEMSAFHAAKWARHALLSLNVNMLEISWLRSMVEVDENGKLSLSKIADLEMAGVAAIGILNVLSAVPESVMDSLMDDMLACCEFMPDPKLPLGRPVVDQVEGDIEEPSTIITLQASAIGLHLDFLKTAVNQATGR